MKKEIKLAGIKDYQDVYQLYLQEYQYHFKLVPDYYSDISKKENKLRLKQDLIRILKNKDEFVYLLYLNCQAAGMIVGKVLDLQDAIVANPLTGYISKIYIKRQYRNQGLGQVLFKEAVNWFKQKKVNNLSTYMAYNNRAGKWWQSLGFKPVEIFYFKKLAKGGKNDKK